MIPNWQVKTGARGSDRFLLQLLTCTHDKTHFSSEERVPGSHRFPPVGICVGTGAPEPSSAGARGLSQQPVVPSALSGFSLSAERQNNEYISHMHKQRQTTPPLLFFSIVANICPVA